MRDKTGRELRLQQIVDIMADGMLTAIVVEVRQGGIADARTGRIEPGLVVLQVGIPIHADPGGVVPVYIVAEPEDLKRDEKSNVVKIKEKIH